MRQAAAIQEYLDHAVEGGRVEVPGDDRHDRGIAGGGRGILVGQPSALRC
jgi:hypothetical protein